MVRIKLATVAVIFFLGISNIYGQNLETARNYALAERFDDAKEALNKIIQSDPKNVSAYFYLGQTIIREYLADSISNSITDVCTDAKKAFETGLQSDSSYVLNFVGKGMLEQLCNNDTTAANRYFKRALVTFPKNKKKYTETHAVIYAKIAYASTMGKLKRYPNAIYYLNLAKEVAPQSFEVALQAGDIFLDRKDGSNAIQNFSRAGNINPESPLPLIKKGDLMLAAKNYNQARDYYDQAKEIDSTNAAVYKSYGELWNTAGRYDLAKDNFRKYLTLSGNNIPAKVSYVNSLYKTKDYDEAITVIEEIQAVDNTRNYLNRVGGYSSFDKKNPDYEKANKFLTTFFENAKSTSITARDYLYYGRTLIKLKANNETIGKGLEMLNKSYEMTEDNSLVTEMGLAYMFIDDFDNAIKTFERKVSNGTATTFDLIQLGRSYIAIKDYVKAGETFDKVVAADPKNMEALMRAANAYANQDPESKLGLAKPKYEAIIALGETDPKKYSRELFEAYHYFASFYLYGDDKGDNLQSEEYFKKIISLDSNNKDWLTTAYSGLATLYVGLAPQSTGTTRWEQAKSMFQELVKLDPTNQTAKKAINDIQKQINVIKVMGKSN
jgi:tetratricopeptide (TPR) repeat protein